MRYDNDSDTLPIVSNQGVHSFNTALDLGRQAAVRIRKGKAMTQVWMGKYGKIVGMVFFAYDRQKRNIEFD